MTSNVITFLFFILSLCHVIQSVEFESFRMSNINSIWNKAQKQLEGTMLSDLYADLVVQDKKERELKQRKHDGTDRDGLYEAQVTQDLINILMNYGLSNHFQSEKYGTKRGKQKDVKIDIRDERLKSMLKSARKEGFNDAEMQILKEEMSHYQAKLDQYNMLQDDYANLEGKIDNSLDNLDEQEDTWQKLSRTKQHMKQSHKEFREGVERLKAKIADKDNVAGKFEDPRVYHLWALAQKSGMDEEELENYRKELTHFETRIKKSEFLEEQLKHSETKIRNGEIVDKSEHYELKDHHARISQKVDKYHEDLKQKVQRRIDEL